MIVSAQAVNQDACTWPLGFCYGMVIVGRVNRALVCAIHKEFLLC